MLTRGFIYVDVGGVCLPPLISLALMLGASRDVTQGGYCLTGSTLSPYSVISDIFATPWTVACQAPWSMGILQARSLEWVAMLPPGDLPNPRIEPRSPTLQADSLPSELPGKPSRAIEVIINLFKQHINKMTTGYQAPDIP